MRLLHHALVRTAETSVFYPLLERQRLCPTPSVRSANGIWGITRDTNTEPKHWLLMSYRCALVWLDRYCDASGFRELECIDE